MVTEDKSWAEYFYPETFDASTMRGTLRNQFGERDHGVLSALEFGSITRRQRQLMSGEVDVLRTYDASHVRSIHRHLFQDVYDWAGEYRTVNLFKSTPTGFADVKGGEIRRYLKGVQGLIKATPWPTLDLDEFAERAATVFAYLNQAHPFREGQRAHLEGVHGARG